MLTENDARGNDEKTGGGVSRGKAGAVLLLMLAGSGSIFCEPFDTELHLETASIKHAAAPRVVGSNILLSYSAPPMSQSVSLALEHEDYRVLHRYQKNKHGVFVLSLPLPEGRRKIRYRLIVDGLWSTDPNAKTERDSRRFLVSYFLLETNSAAPAPGVKLLADGRTRFICQGNPGDRVFLVGDFNGWDPFLTPMPESPVYPGVYSVTLTLPGEAKYYRYVLNGRETIDPANPKTARSNWGEMVSVIR